MSISNAGNPSCWKSRAYYDLFSSNSYDYGYWLSSRAVRQYDISHCYFGLQYVSKSNIAFCGLCDVSISSGSKTEKRGFGMRPIISFPRSMYELEEQVDGSYNIFAK